MAEESAISWTRSTFNPWIGCTKIGPGCDACYAKELDDKRMSKTLGGGTRAIPISHWGAGAPRYRTSESNWNQVLRWNRQAIEERGTGILTAKSTWKGRVGHWQTSPGAPLTRSVRSRKPGKRAQRVLPA